MVPRFALLVVAVLAALDAAIVWTVPHEGDWYQFWYAGHIVVHGGSPYDAAAWRPAVEQPEIVGSVVNIVRLNCAGPEPAACLWRYPPWTALIYAPFGALPIDAGVTLLDALTIATGIAALIMLLRRYGVGSTAPTLMIAAALAAQPLVLATRTGHLDALLLVGVLLVAAGLNGRTSALVGGALLLSLKPHLLILFAAAIAVVLARRRRWRTMATAVGSLGALAAVSSVAFPPPLGALLGDTSTRISFDVPTLWALHLADGWGWGIVGVLAAVAGGAAALALRWSPPGDDVLVAVTLALSVALAPYAQSYDHALLLPVVLVALAAASSLRPPALRAAGLTVVTAVAVAYPWWAYLDDIVTRSQASSALVPVLTLVAFAAVTAARHATLIRATTP